MLETSAIEPCRQGLRFLFAIGFTAFWVLATIGCQDRPPTPPAATYSPTPRVSPETAKPTPSTGPTNPAEWRAKNFTPRPFKEFEGMRGYWEVKALRSKPSSPESIKSGQALYQKSCVKCHDLAGAPLRRDPALVEYNMADLARPQQYKYGSTPRSVFRSIAYGVPSPPMGVYNGIHSDQEIWDIVNFVVSLQKS